MFVQVIQSQVSDAGVRPLRLAGQRAGLGPAQAVTVSTAPPNECAHLRLRRRQARLASQPDADSCWAQQAPRCLPNRIQD